MQSKPLFLAVPLIALLFLPSTSPAQQVWIDGTDRGNSYTNQNGNIITTATVDGGAFLILSPGLLSNYGTIADATVNNSGFLYNYEDGTITAATVNGGGRLDNNIGGTIDTTTVNTNGTLNNYYGGMIGTATVNGGRLGNNGGITGATVHGGTLNNNPSGAIGNATVNGGKLENNSGGMLTNVTINTNGTLNNYYGGMIDYASVSSGELGNWGRIDNATVNDGIIVNGRNTKQSDATINELIVIRGTVYNDGTTIVNVYDRGGGIIAPLCSTHSGGTISNAILLDGNIYNNGTISNITVNGGRLENRCGEYSSESVFPSYTAEQTISEGTIDTITQYGGTISNGGRIDEMAYFDGAYYYGELDGSSGTIGTLTIAGDATGIDWGNVGSILFHENGLGVLSLTAVIDEPIATMGMSMPFDFQAMNASLPGISFVGFNAQNIDFTYGNITLDLSGLAGFSEADVLSSLFAEGFMVAAFLGTANVTGVESLNSFQLAKGDEWFYVFNNGVLADGWFFDSADGLVSWDGITAVVWNSAEAPEPATLLMLGLAAAGLPVVKRLRKVDELWRKM